MAKKQIEEPEEETKKKKEEWEVKLVITNEEKPPQKVLTKGDETLDDWAFKAKVLNKLDELEEGMLS